MSKSLRLGICLIAIWCLISIFAVPSPAYRVIQVVASRYSFEPSVIKVKKGEAVTLELSSKDVKHGFNAPDLGVRAVITPGQVSKVSFTAEKTGSFTFYCDIFCGSGHDDMNGKIEVTN